MPSEKEDWKDLSSEEFESESESIPPSPHEKSTELNDEDSTEFEESESFESKKEGSDEIETKIQYKVGVLFDINIYIENAKVDEPKNSVFVVLPVDENFRIAISEDLKNDFYNKTNLHIKTLALNKFDLKMYQRDGFATFTPILKDGSELNFSIIAANFSPSDNRYISNVISAIQKLNTTSFISLVFLVPGFKDEEPFFLDGTNQLIKLAINFERFQNIINVAFSLPDYGKDTTLAKQLLYSNLKSVDQAKVVVDSQKSPQDKIDFHLDDPAFEDKLGRKPIANSLGKLINDDIFGNKKCYAFMAHLQGRWGEGKSSFMKFLEDGLQDAGDNRWVIIHYNAWKNQYVEPPWWTFLDAIYKQGTKNVSKVAGRRFKWRIKVNENIRRLNSSLLLALSITAFIIFLILSTGAILGFSFTEFDGTSDTIVSVTTILASLWAIGQAWSKFFVMDSPENARLFMRKAENPSAKIKQHFKELINDLQTKHKKKNSDHKIAVFIDDLDRCEGKFVVSLLEGIQTMFNEQKVFYLVAADKHWVAKSFENVYSDYTDTVKRGTKLGYSFIEKNFQLSIRLPNPSKEQISRYWGHILKHKVDESPKNVGDKEGLKEKIKETGQEAVLSGETNLEELAEEYNTTIEDAQSIMLEAVNETTEDIEHLLMEHHKLLGNNPRAVKRLANQYTVYRNLVLIEQNKVDPLKLFRWVVLQNRWPVLIDKLEQDPAHINDYDELLEDLNLVSYSIDIDYVMGKDEERLTTEDVITFTGIGNLVNSAD